jgi:hypothetical protein
LINRLPASNPSVPNSPPRPAADGAPQLCKGPGQRHVEEAAEHASDAEIFPARDGKTAGRRDHCEAPRKA